MSSRKTSLIHSASSTLYPGVNYTLALIPFWVPLIATLLLPTAALTRSAIRYAHRRLHPSPGHCPQCHYNLTANESGACPECGMPVLQHGLNANPVAAANPPLMSENPQPTTTGMSDHNRKRHIY